jgi:hypothetical protein
VRIQLEEINPNESPNSDPHEDLTAEIVGKYVRRTRWGQRAFFGIEICGFLASLWWLFAKCPGLGEFTLYIPAIPWLLAALASNRVCALTGGVFLRRELESARRAGKATTTAGAPERIGSMPEWAVDSFERQTRYLAWPSH